MNNTNSSNTNNSKTNNNKTNQNKKMDYEKLGLKCGIEIHQQLDTNKLFCSCPSLLRDDKPDIVIARKLRASAGEAGAVDIAAKHEQEKEKEIIYEAYSDTTCLVELDEEPPHDINKEALTIVLEVALLLKADIIKNIQIMRKTVVDGSNTSGFQRTALVANSGLVETKQGKVRIDSVCVEEDAAKIIEQGKDFVKYRLDRLGIPLVEIATYPDIKNPEQCKEVAEYIGMILRSTGKVKRGLGTIRQDINVSIKQGERVEIKGAQDLKMLPLLVENEVLRQLSLVELKSKASKEKAKKEFVDLTEIFKSSESKIIKSGLEKKGIVLGVKLPLLKGILGKQTQPGKRVGSELSDYAKIKAGVGGIFHTDELPNYGITQKNIDDINKKLRCRECDAFVIVCDSAYKSEKALAAAVDRSNMLNKGVLKEVRKANPDGTTSFMRPMPGSARMYPETDVSIIRITENTIKQIKLPELIQEKSERYKEKHMLGKDLADLLAKSGKTDFFEHIIDKCKNLKASFVAEVLLTTEKNLKRNFNLDVKIPDNVFEYILSELNKGSIVKNALENIFLNYAKTRNLDLSKYKLMDEQTIKNEIKKIMVSLKKNNKDIKKNTKEEINEKILIGVAMERLRSKADPKKVITIIKDLMKNR